MIKLLFICSYNRWRSLTAEHLFRGKPGIAVRSAGTEASARHVITAGDIGWADLILVMEKKHQERLAQRFPIEVKNKRIVCLHIDSGYEYMDPELVARLTSALEEYVPLTENATQIID